MRRNWLVGVAVALALFGLIRGLTAGALWDPHEVTVAEFGRRLALNLWGGSQLRLPGADNSVPVRSELGRGELPFTLVAIGFRIGGLSALAGRLPLALTALVGLASLYAGLATLWHRRVALYGVLVLATTPLYFLQARTLLGEAATLACFAMAWSGLAVACLAGELSGRVRAGFALLGAVGLYAGFWCRGAIVSVAVPALAVGVPALLWRRHTRAGFVGGVVTTLLGLLALGLGAKALSLATQSGDYSVFVGAATRSVAVLPTFDVPFGQLAHALFPWSAALPLALVLTASGVGSAAKASAPRTAAVQSAALGLGLGLCAVGWLSASVGALALPSVACFAVLVAVAVAELEQAERASPLLGLVVAAAVLVIAIDLRENSEKVLSGFELPSLSLPESLQGFSSAVWLAGGGALAVTAALCLYERDDGTGARFERAEYARVLAAWQRAWDGNLLFAMLLLETMLVGFLLLSAISERLVPLPQLDGFGSFWRKLVAWGAITLPLTPLVPLLAMLGRDAARALFSSPRADEPKERVRAQALLLGFAAVGLAGSLSFYPALAAQVSPKEAFERYRALSGGSEPLGVLGEQSGAARYQGAPGALALDGADAACDWLTESGAQRRWLVLKSSELAELNACFRERARRNLPVLDARSSEVLLASNRLGAGEHDDSPLARSVLDAPPQIEHPLHAVLDQKLEVLGFDLRSAAGVAERQLAPGEPYRFTVYYRVLHGLSGSWQSFVHLDGLQRRFNADHELVDGKYPLRLWRTGDIIADATEIRLEPNFSPGDYRLYFGLFIGERRLPVSEGPAAEDRIQAGTLQVR
ncbi:MAG TPA: hypothetical protein VHB79_14070 [Polyangiaceae bacterium]|nr:hypothetical protein [Polyangiaceae bacterium]